MRVLVLGGSGFIGSHLVDRLLLEGHQVKVFDHAPERYRNIPSDVEFVQGEFLDVKQVEEVLEGTEVVYHLIGTTLPETSNKDVIFDLESNVVATVKLLQACVRKGVKRFVFNSSGGTVYGIPGELPVGEGHATNPICAYGISKLTVEKYIHLFSHLYGLEFAIARPGNPYGERQNPFGIQGAVNVFMGKIAKGETIEIWGNGEVVRDYFYVGDLAKALELLGSQEGAKNRIFNIGSGKGLSLNSLLKEILLITGIESKLKYLSGRGIDVPAIYLDTSKIRESIGWQPTTSLSVGLKMTWDWIQNVIAHP